MEPVKLVIPGNYYDSQLYEGRLYLWSVDDGKIHVYDWDAVIGRLGVPPRLALASKCAFQESAYLYHPRNTILFQDADVKRAVTTKFVKLGSLDLRVKESALKRAVVKIQENPFPFPHGEAIVYHHEMYVASSDGVHSGRLNRKKGNPIVTRTDERWSGAATGIAASYNRLALSAASEGLFALSLSRWGSPTEPLQLSTKHSTRPSWTYWSIYSSSNLASGFLAEYERVETQSGTQSPGGIDVGSRPTIEFRDILDSSDIFGSNAFSWGKHDKICQVVDGTVVVVRYRPWMDEFSDRFIQIAGVRTGTTAGELVAVDSALFGFVLEYEKGILILRSDGRRQWIPGEPVNWRVLPASKFYENHLHIIYDDRLEVWSFNHDYFVDQETKVSGTKFSQRKWNAT